MIEIISITSNTTLFRIDSEDEISEIIRNFKRYEIDIFLNAEVVQVHIPACIAVQAIAENTTEYRWVGEDNVVS